jgi:hypothetical protein
MGLIANLVIYTKLHDNKVVQRMFIYPCLEAKGKEN